MKLHYLVLALPLFASQPVGAAEQEFRFSGAVRAGATAIEKIDVSVPFGKTKSVILSSGLTLEMKAPSRDNASPTIVRLLNIDGKAHRILHLSHTTGPAAVELGFAYLVCGEKVTYFSSPPASIPTCKEQAVSQ